MTNAVSAMGTFLSWDGVEIAEITNASGPTATMETTDATHYGSFDNCREFIAAFLSGGELNIEAHFVSGDTAGQIAFITDFQARSEKAVVLTLPVSASTQLEFNAICEALDFQYPQEGILAFTATFRITGAITRRTTASTGISAMTGIEENGGASLTFSPTFANGTYYYKVSVNTASTYIKLTVTAASHTIKVKAAGASYTLTTGVESDSITIGAAGSETLVSVNVYESEKVAKVYRILVTRAAA